MWAVATSVVWTAQSEATASARQDQHVSKRSSCRHADKTRHACFARLQQISLSKARTSRPHSGQLMWLRIKPLNMSSMTLSSRILFHCRCCSNLHVWIQNVNITCVCTENKASLITKRDSPFEWKPVRRDGECSSASLKTRISQAKHPPPSLLWYFWGPVFAFESGLCGSREDAG